MGGTDHPNNIIELSVEEHAEAHLELYKKHGKQEDYLAWKSLTKQIGHEQIFAETSRIGGLKNKGKLKTEEHKSKISHSNTGSESHWKKGDAQKKKLKLSKSMKNNINSKNHSSAEYKAKQSIAMKKAWAKRKINNFRRDG